jgi:hypothetical protein
MKFFGVAAIEQNRAGFVTSARHVCEVVLNCIATQKKIRVAMDLLFASGAF